MAALQRLFSKFPAQINRENISGNRELFLGIREFLVRGVSVHFSHTCFVRLRTRSVLTDSFAGAGAFLWARLVIDLRTVRIGAGLFLIGWALYHWRYGHRHRVRVGVQAGLATLRAWSFLMATTHGAGLML
jgi:hypothetical protein